MGSLVIVTFYFFPSFSNSFTEIRLNLVNTYREIEIKKPFACGGQGHWNSRV